MKLMCQRKGEFEVERVKRHRLVMTPRPSRKGSHLVNLSEEDNAVEFNCRTDSCLIDTYLLQHTAKWLRVQHRR